MFKKVQTKNEDELWYFDKENDKPWLKPGLIFKLIFATPFKEFNEDEYIELPAIVLNTYLHNDRPPSHDVGFYTRWFNDGISGLLVIKDMMPSRYTYSLSIDKEFSKKVTDFFKEFNNREYGIITSSLFYIQNQTETERELVYPFVEELKENKEIKEV